MSKSSASKTSIRLGQMKILGLDIRTPSCRLDVIVELLRTISHNGQAVVSFRRKIDKPVEKVQSSPRGRDPATSFTNSSEHCGERGLTLLELMSFGLASSFCVPWLLIHATSAHRVLEK